MLFIAQALYLFLPAYTAKYVPFFAQKIPTGNHRLCSWSILTLNGILSAIFSSLLVFALQKYLLFQPLRSLALIDYADFSLFYGFFLGVGVVAGNVANDFYKHY